MALARIKLTTGKDQIQNPFNIGDAVRMEAYDGLCFFLDRTKQRNSTSAILNQASSQSVVHALSQVRIRVQLFLRFKCVFVQPFHERKMKSRPLIQELRGVEVQVTERGENKTAFWRLCRIREVLSIVGSKFHDEPVVVYF